MLLFAMTFIVMLGGERDEDGGKHAEYNRLHHTHERSKHHQRKRSKQRSHAEHDAKEQVVECDVDEETKGERHGTQAGRENLDAEDEQVDRDPHRAKPRSEQVADVAHALLFDAVIVERQEHDERAAEGDAQVRRGRQKARDHAEEVAEQDEQRTGSNDGEVELGALRTHHVLHHGVEVPDHQLEERTQAKLFVRDDGFLVVLDLSFDEEGEADHQNRNEGSRDQRLGLVRIDGFPHHGVAKVLHVLAKGGEHGNQVAEKRGMFGHRDGPGLP